MGRRVRGCERENANSRRILEEEGRGARERERKTLSDTVVLGEDNRGLLGE